MGEQQRFGEWSVEDRGLGEFVPSKATAAERFEVLWPECRYATESEAIAEARGAAAWRELLAALKMVRNNWGGHSEQCVFVTSRYRGQCDCDWPKVAKQCDAAIAKATGEGS